MGGLLRTRLCDDSRVLQLFTLPLSTPLRSIRGFLRKSLAFLDVFDDVPTDAQVVGHRLDGHVLGQLQGVTLKRPGVAAPRVGEGHVHLAYHAAGQAADALHGQDDGHGAAADGHGPEAALGLAPANHLTATAGWATPVLGILGDGEGHAALGVVGPAVVVAADGKGMVQ